MPELRERFGAVDGLDAPDLWGEASRRATDEVPEPRVGVGPAVPWSRLGTIAVAFAVFVAAVLFAWDVATPDRSPRPEPAVDLSAELPAGWSELPAPPENRSGSASAWTGRELLVWGGYQYVGSGDEDPERDGFSFDAATRSWRPMPESPLFGRMDAASAWTGRELVIWGGWDGGFRADDPFFDDGAAYDPTTRTWRTLAPAPISSRSPFSVWTGEELIVWGSTVRHERMLDGAAYDPTSDTWRPIAEAPVEITDGSAVWTGDEMIVVGAALDLNNASESPTAIGIAYDPDLDTWRRLPASELSPQAVTASWLGGEVVAWDYELSSQAYDPQADSWRTLPELPLSPVECAPKSVATARVVLGEYCGEIVLFPSAENAWTRDPLELRQSDDASWVLEPIAAGDVVFVSAHRWGFRAGEPRLFVYDPPSVVRGDPRGEMLEPEPFFPATERDGELLRMPVVFPDGTTATLVYPISLGLEQLGVQPDVSYVWMDDAPPRYPIVFLHDPDASIARFVDEEGPMRLVNTSCGGLEVWRARGNDIQRRFWIRYELPGWTVLVSVRDALESAVEVHCSLRIVETEDGFPLVRAVEPLLLAEGFGEAEGAQLAFGDAAAEPEAVSQLDATIFLSPDGCLPGSESSGTYGSTCLADGEVFASIYGDRGFVASVIAGLRVEDVRVAPRGVT